MARFTNLESFSVLFHPFPHGQSVFEPANSYTILDLYGTADLGYAERPSYGTLQTRMTARLQESIERARLPCQDIARNTKFPRKGRYLGEYFSWKERLLSRYLSYLEEYRPDRQQNQGFSRHDSSRPFPYIEGEGSWQNGGN